MANKGTQDPRYRINVPPGTRVTIKEEGNPDLIPGYVKKIITTDPSNEMGIMVLCEDGRKGRVHRIGTETTHMQPLDLIISLEAKLRKLIVDELSKDCPEWWEIKIPLKIRKNVAKIKQKRHMQIQQIPRYDYIEEIYFSDLSSIILEGENWENHFVEIFHDDNSLMVKLSELSVCRNVLAHSKKPTKHMERKIRVYYDDIILLVEEHNRHRRKSK